MFGFQFPVPRNEETVGSVSRFLRRAHSRARVRLLLGAGATILLLSGVPSDAKTVKRRAPRAAQVSQNTSGLGAGDVISITVLGHTDISKESLTIPGSGQISLPYGVGAVKITGQSQTQAARTIARALSRELVDPQVTVELKQPRVRRVVILGSLGESGGYDMEPGWRISDAIAAAAVSGRPDDIAGTLTRKGMTPVRINLKTIQSNPSSSANIRLREGDTLSFRALETKLITVSGDVQRPGKYPLRTVPRLLEAITLAGQLKGRADETTATLTRRGKLIALDVQAVQDNPSSPKNVKLQAGDILLFTARDPKTITVSGDVQKPGKYALRSAPRLLEAITLAGQLKGRADETTATLTRGGQVKVLDVQAIQDNPASPKNVLLKAGDVLSFQLRDPKMVRVSGDVQKQGEYPLRSARRLLDALLLAGGTKEGTAQTNATLFRKNGEEIELDLLAAETQNTLQTNIALQDDDLIVVKSIPKLQVTVTGPFVRNAGNFQLLPGSGVAQAVAQASGVTVPLEQVRATIARGATIIPVDLRQAALDPRANIPLQSGDAVFINEPDIIRIQVAGAVNKQGEARMAPGTTLLDALNKGAGGISTSLQPEETRISVVRTRSQNTTLVALPASGAPSELPNAVEGATSAPIKEAAAPRTQVVGDRELISINTRALLGNNDLRQNITLQDGDLVSVSQVKSPTVIVSGQVGKTGPYQIVEGEGIAQLLARAGAATNDAALTRVVLQRGGQSRTLDVYDEVFSGAKPQVVLQDGDNIIVPQNTSRVMVMNAVVKPGSIAIPERKTLTITDAISEAGGLRERGIKEVALLRPTPGAPGKAERRIVSLDKIYRGDLSENVVLRPGDFLYVPDAKAPRPSLLGLLGQAVGTLTGLRYVTGQ